MRKERNHTPDIFAVCGCFLLHVGSRIIASLLATAVFYILAVPKSLTPDALAQAASDFAARYNLAIVAGANVIVLLALFIASRVRKRGFLAHCRLRSRPRPGSSVFYCIAAGVAANFWLTFVLYSGIVPQSALDSYQSAFEPVTAGPQAVELVTLLLLAPIVEEVLFRGIILSHLKNMVPQGAAIFFQGMLFGCVHGDPLWIIYAGVLGCVIGLVRVRCASVWAGIAFHIAFNAASYLFTMFAHAAWDVAPLRVAVFILSALTFIACMWKITSRPKLVK